MRFYYPSVISMTLIGVFYALALIGLWLWWTKSLKRRFAGPAAWSVVAMVLVAPWVEELWIAWNFGQLCRKDAGIVINKTVKVEGFYDSTRPTHAGKRNPQAVADLDRGGYKFYEMVLQNHKDGPNQVVHLQKLGGEWAATILDKPTARYHYRWSYMDTHMSHKVDKIERVVADSQTEELLARETKYRRRAHWFYIGLDRPVMLCPAPGEDPLSKYGSVFNLALKPTQSQ